MREGEQAGVDGSAEGRGHEVRDEGVVREGLRERCALGLAEGSEGWVGEGVVCGGEVVIALRVAD